MDQPIAHKPFPDGEFTEQELRDLGACNALTNQEAKIVLRRFMDSHIKANKLWAPPTLAAKAMDYLTKVEPKTDVEHSETVSRLRDVVQAANIYEYEMALLSNLTPERAEEAIALVPSLGKDERFVGEGKQVLDDTLEQLITLKQLQ